MSNPDRAGMWRPERLDARLSPDLRQLLAANTDTLHTNRRPVDFCSSCGLHVSLDPEWTLQPWPDGERLCLRCHEARTEIEEWCAVEDRVNARRAATTRVHTTIAADQPDPAPLPTTQWWIVTGRNDGDDEDSLFVVQAESEDAAAANATEQLRGLRGDAGDAYESTAEDAEAGEAEDERPVYINHIVACGAHEPKITRYHH